MECPFCHKAHLIVINSRSSKGKSQIWRRRKCLSCKEVFTTHELIDLSHIVVEKKSGSAEMFSRTKLYSGIFYASQQSKIPKREMVIDAITQGIEKDIFNLKKKRLTSGELIDIVLIHLKKRHIPTFLRYLTYGKKIETEAQLRRELGTYIEI